MEIRSNRKSIKLLICIAFIVGCTQNPGLTIEEGVETITFNIDINSAEAFKFSDFFEEPVFVPLETNEESVLPSMLKQVVIGDSLVFIVPSVPSNSVYMFSKSGEFRGSFCNSGRGPDEYVALEWIFVNEDSETITATDPFNRSIITMDYSGRIKERYKLKDIKFVAWDVFEHPSEKYFLINVSEGVVTEIDNANSEYKYYHILYVNPGDNRISRLLPMPFGMSNAGIRSFSYYDNEVYYKPPRFDTIYIVRGDTLLPRYVFNFGDNAERSNLLKSADKSKLNDFLQQHGVVNIHRGFREIRKYIFSTHSITPARNLFHIYNKNERVSKSYTRVINDYLGCPQDQEFLFALLPFHFDDEYVYYLHSTYILFLFFNKLKESMSEKEFNSYLESQPGYSRLMNNLDESDNHVLVIYKIKD